MRPNKSITAVALVAAAFAAMASSCYSAMPISTASSASSGQRDGLPVVAPDACLNDAILVLYDSTRTSAAAIEQAAKSIPAEVTRRNGALVLQPTLGTNVDSAMARLRKIAGVTRVKRDRLLQPQLK